MKNRLISFVCILSILVSCFSFAAVYGSDDVLSIIDACYLPYDGQVSVLAIVPSDSDVKMCVFGRELDFTYTSCGEYTLFTSDGFVADSYGIVPVTLSATRDSLELSDSRNIEIVKAFSNNLSFEEDFDSLQPMFMSNTSDTTVTDAVNLLQSGKMILSSVPTSSYTGRYADITNTYTTDASSALTMRFQSSADKGLPTLKLDPSTDGTNGIVELSYDFYTTSPYIRQTVYPISRAYNSAITFTTQDGSSFTSSFQVANYSTYCFGSSDKKVESNTWYNVRFLLNLNALTFEFYVNNELINYGSFTYNDSKIGQYIYGINYFSLSAGAQGKAGASDKNPVNVTFDNLRITHTDIGASACELSYTSDGEECQTDIMNATVAPDADSIILRFDNALSCESDDISLQTANGTKINAEVTHTQGQSLSAKASRSIISIIPKQSLEVEEEYQIILCENVKSGSTAYGLITQIPFLAGGVPTVISPLTDSKAEPGEPIDIKAYSPGCVSADLYIDDIYITTLLADDSKCVSYQYNTTPESIGEKCITLVLFAADGTSHTLTRIVNIVQSNTTDIIPLETFEKEVSSDYFSVVKQKSADSARMAQTQIEGRNAAAFYFVANSNTNRKVIQVQKSVDCVQTGRVVLEFDMYIAKENRKAELSISFGDGVYTFYPLDIAKQFSKDCIAGIEMPYYGWHRVKFVMDTFEGSSNIFFDGNQVGETCYTIDNTYYKSDVAAPESMTGFRAFTISLWQAQSYTAGEEYLGFAMDNWHVYKETALPTIESVIGTEKYENGQLIPCDTTAFELEISNAGYVDSASLAESFVLRSNGKKLNPQNVTFADGKLAFNIESLPQNDEIEFVLSKDTVISGGEDTLGKDVVFVLKTADSNGIYCQKTVNVHDSATNVVFTLGALTEQNISAVVACYKYNKLVSVTGEKLTVKDIQNKMFTVSNDGITHVRAFAWSGDDMLLPLSQKSVATVGNSNVLGLSSVFEPDSVAISYIDNAVIFKEDTDALVYNKQKYRYSELTDAYPYISTKDVFMISADLFAKVFGINITTSGNKVIVDAYGETTIGSPVILAENGQIGLDNPFEVNDGVLYVPLRSIAQDILGKTYMYDRGMHIFDDEEFKYSNSSSTYETKEPIDSVYRLLQFEHKKSTDIYAMTESHLGGNVHPRILTDAASLDKIKSDSLTNPVVAEALSNTLSEADGYLDADVQEYVIPDGVRLLTAARNVMERLVTLSAAYLVTDDTRYADRAWLEIENCFAWPDWNTDKHYLDNSELLYGVAVAFDSFYDYYTEEQKQTILDKTWELSLRHTVDRYQGINFSGSEWRTARSNWGFVCNGAVISAILAFGMENEYRYQPYYDYLLDCALQAIEYPLMLYYPDGAWEEGLAYWEYSLRYLTTSVLVPLYYSTGSTLDFMKPEGADKIADMGLYMQSGNYAFNFSDNGSESKRPCESVYAYAMLTGDDDLMQIWNYEMDSMNAVHGARTLMWYRPSDDGGASDASVLSLDSFFRGIEVGSMKQQWYNTDGSVVFFKGGQNNSRSHLDTGTFCFDTMGKRWSVDPGKDSYNIEGGYNGFAGCELYVKRPEGHNCVVINPREDIAEKYYGGQYVDGRAPITDMQSSDTSAFAVVDLSDTYKYDTDSYIRGFYLGDNRRTLVVQDEIDLKKDNSSLYWFMHTRAKIELDSDGKGAYLVHGAKKLRVDMLTNADNARFVINSVGPDIQRFPTDPIREGQLQGGSFTNIKVLTLEAKGSGNVYITVKLTPVDSDFDAYDSVSYVPISNWTLK